MTIKFAILTDFIFEEFKGPGDLSGSNFNFSLFLIKENVNYQELFAE